MKYIYELYVVILSCTVFSMDINDLGGYLRSGDSIQKIKITDNINIKDNNITYFYMFRHAKTILNHQDLVQGNSIDSNVYLTSNEDIENIEYLSQINFDKIYANDYIRTQTTVNLITTDYSKIENTWLFNEQNLGRFEGKYKKDVIQDKEFQKMSSDPNYRIPYVEAGIDVINRFLYAINNISSPGKTIGICTCQCAMNWFMKWATEDYKTIYQIHNLDVIPFLYDIDNKKIQLLSEMKIVSPIDALAFNLVYN